MVSSKALMQDAVTGGVVGYLLQALPTAETVAKWQYNDKHDGKQIIAQIALFATRQHGAPDNVIDALGCKLLDAVLEGCAVLRMGAYFVRQADMQAQADLLDLIERQATALALENMRTIEDIINDVRSLFGTDACSAIDNMASNFPGAFVPPQRGEGAECDLSQLHAADIMRALGLDEYEGYPLNPDEDDMVRDVVAQFVQDTLRQRTDIYDAEYWRAFADVYGSNGAEA